MMACTRVEEWQAHGALLDAAIAADLRRLVERILPKHGYPPDKQEKAPLTVFEQTEALSAGRTARSGVDIGESRNPKRERMRCRRSTMRPPSGPWRDAHPGPSPAESDAMCSTAPQ